MNTDHLSSQYLLDDSAYSNIIYLIASYKALHVNNSDIWRFNKRLSRIQIDIEHAFDILKSRWKSLIDLRLQIRDIKDYTYAIRWIIACVVLHNILVDIQNDWDEEEEWWTTEDESYDKELKQLTILQIIESTTKIKHVKELILSND
jgi:hypothetical protein